MSFAEYVRTFDNEWWRITLLGEPLMMVPLALIVLVWLWRSCGARTMLAWGGLLVLGGSLLVAQKLLYYVGGFSLSSIRLYTMSGHSLAASYIYGSLAAIVARGWPAGCRWAVYVLAAGLILAIAVSRVAVAQHRPSEAIGGLTLGVLLLACYLRFYWSRARTHLAGWTLTLPCLLVMALTYGHVFEFENIFRQAGRWANPGVRFYR